MFKLLLTILLITVFNNSNGDELITDVYINSEGFMGFVFVKDTNDNSLVFELTLNEIEQVEIKPLQSVSLNGINTSANNTQNLYIHNHDLHPIIYGIDGTFSYTSKSITKAIIAASAVCSGIFNEEGEHSIPFLLWGINEFIGYKEIEHPPYGAPKLELFHEDAEYTIANPVKFKCVFPLMAIDTE